MIKSLQRKFVLISSGSILVVIVVLIGLINGVNMYNMDKRIDGMLWFLSGNDGNFPDLEKTHPSDIKMTPETRFETRYFLVKADESGNITQIDIGHIAAISSEDAKSYAEEVLSQKKQKGYNGIYKYLIVEKEYGKLLVFLDCNSEIETRNSFFLLFVSVGILCFIAVFAVIWGFSKRAIKPVVENIEKQRQFITDAGHEIKTPLAIISANADVLELSCGENEWVTSIRNQTKRLNELVKNLLTLSKIDEGKVRVTFSEFILSEAAHKALEPFILIAESKNIKFDVQIEPSLRIIGDYDGIQTLISILAENAVKYTENNGQITVELSKTGKNIKLEIKNNCKALPSGDLNRLFDRFYRADSSRSRETGGYGIGLSIAQAIVNAHKGKISVRVDNGNVICFTVIFY